MFKPLNFNYNHCSVENIAEDLEQQQEDIADLDVKVDATIGTVITIGDKIIEHDKEIGELEEGLEQVEERVDDVEEDLGDTKIKVEEIDNKVHVINFVYKYRDSLKYFEISVPQHIRFVEFRKK